MKGIQSEKLRVKGLRGVRKQETTARASIAGRRKRAVEPENDKKRPLSTSECGGAKIKEKEKSYAIEKAHTVSESVSVADVGGHDGRNIGTREPGARAN